MDTLPPHASNSNHDPVPSTAGVYKITCTVNGKAYIGSAVNLRRRKDDHFRSLRRNQHGNSYLQRAFNKYGESVFTFEVLELILIPEMLTAREQYWFGKLKPFGKRGFNILTIAGSPLGYKHTPETIAKVRKAHTGKKRSPEAREKMRQAHVGKPSTFKGKSHTPEAREKLRQARSRQQMTPEAIEKARRSNTGKKRTPEQIEASRQAKLTLYARKREAGEKHPNTGKKRTEEQRERFSQAQQKMRSTKKSASSTGFRGISVYQKKRNNRIESTTYKFSCQCMACKMTKYFPYTEAGLEAARVFAEAHYAAMKKE